MVNGGQTYNLSYDGENRMSSAGYGNIGYGGVLTNYYYDAQNRRIWSWGNAVDALGNTTSYTVNVYTPAGQKLGEYLFVPGTTTQQGADVAYINVTISASDQYFGSRRVPARTFRGARIRATRTRRTSGATRRIGGIRSAGWITRTTATTPIPMAAS